MSSQAPTPGTDGPGSTPAEDDPRWTERSASAKPRPAGLRRSPLAMRIGMVVFCIGGCALLVLLVLFASGTRDFPLWFWVLVACAPIGLGVSAFSIRRAGTSLGQP